MGVLVLTAEHITLPELAGISLLITITATISTNSPTLIHFLGSRLLWWHSLYSGSGWLLCLFDTWRIKEFHFARIRLPKPGLVEVADQYRCRRIPLIQSLMISAFLFACLEQLLGHWSCYVPNIIVMGGFNTDLSNPLCNATVTVWNEYCDCQTKSF